MNNEDQDNDRIQDSLDNMSNLKLRQSSLQKHRVELIQVKQKFIGLLEKLQTSQTRQISLSEIKKLIERYNESDHLRIYLSILKSLKPNHNSTTKEHEVLVISIIAKAFRSNLIDPVDKQPTLLKTCFKVVEILLAFFNDSSNTVQQACARVLLDLNEFCLQQGKYEKQQKISVLFAPLISILRNGVDKASQATATVCINQLLKFWYSKSEKQYLDIVSKEIFSIILKINSEYHEIFMAAIILIQHKGLAFFENRLPNFLSKILPIIDGTRQGTNSFNAYMCKVNVCKIIEKVAFLLKPDERQKLSDLNILGSLSKAARNKIIQVQMAATRALKVWRGETVSQQKIERPSTSKGKPGLRSLQEMRDLKKRQRSNSKQNTIKIQNELNYMKEDLQKMVKGGWGANNRAKNYVKRGSGVGGGHYGQLDSATPPKSNKSHREHLQELRSMIKQGVKENKNVDKFDFIEQKRRGHQQQQIPTSSNNNVLMGRNATNNNNNNKNIEKQIQKRQNNNQVIKSKKDSGRMIERIKQTVNNKNSQDEFNEIQDDGDQGVYISVRKQITRKNSSGSNNSKKNITNKQKEQNEQQNQADNVFIDSKQAQQLLRQQQQQQQANRLERGQQQLNFNNVKQKQQQSIIKVKDEKFIKKAQKLKQNLAMLGSMISQQQLQQLMMENNLSQVSDNLSGFLNQSDLNMKESINQSMNHSLRQNLQHNNNNGRQTIKGVMENNFMKKPTSNIGENTYNESLNYTQSRVSNYQKSINNNNNKNNSYNNSYNNTYTNTYLQQQRPSQPIRQQFTLNPNNNKPYQQQQSLTSKFQSIQQQENNNNNDDQEIQEDIVESYFEQSKPKQQHLLPLKTKVSPKSSFSPNQKSNKGVVNSNNNKSNNKGNIKKPNRQKQPYQQQQQQQQQSSANNNNYQQLIQNPPTNYLSQNYQDKKSFIKQQKLKQSVNNNNNYQQHCQQQYGEQQQQTVTDKWIRILSLVQNNQINLAFQQAFLMDDPIYLIRLLIITRTPISSLTAHNCSQLWQKFLDIYKHNFISILFVQLFTQANDLQLIKNSLTIEEMHQLLLKLYEVSGTSKGKLSFNAALLYNKVDQSLRPNKK